MIELLLSTVVGTPPLTFPDSGPGSKSLLAGNADAGYFGFVSGDELLTYADFNYRIPAVGTLVTEPTAMSFGWLKFIYNGRYIFIANYPVRSGVSWNDIYGAGLMYGVDGDGLYPSTTPTNQLKLVTQANETDKRTYVYKVRTIEGNTSDMFTNVSVALASPSEWDTLLPLVPGAVTSGGVVNYGLSFANLTKNTGTNVNNFGSRTFSTANPPVAAQTSVSKATASQYWRPVMELVPPDTTAFGPRNVYSQFDNNNPPYGVTVELTQMAKSPTNVWATQYEMTQPILTSATILP